jgi:4-amino-4-deoxy-L-arabinose transferase-like glycosyltransferase
MTRIGASMQSGRIWVLVLLAGILLRLAFVWRPLDYRLLNSWRECDYTAIARSFYTEGMNIFYPRVDWRGDTPGYAEMEFPILPWSGALLYQIVGYHEQVLRLLSAVCSILSLFAFAGLARRLLPHPGALIATALFAANGLLFALSGAIQPEPLQLLFTILAADAITQWLKEGQRRFLLQASAMTAIAILAKSPAAYLGFLLAYAVLRRLGVRAFSDPLVYVSAAIALVPPALWYAWSHSLYLATGLSLGVSNETHFLTWAMVLHPQDWIPWNVISEWRDVFALFGIFLGVLALLHSWKTIEVPVIWFASVILIYVVAADTSGDSWAYYYHCNSIPPACLLMAIGVLELEPQSRWFKKFGKWKEGLSFAAKGSLALTFIATLARGAQLELNTYRSPELKAMYSSCKEMCAYIPADARIVARGGTRLDRHGHPVAYNESMPFAWMDRKGFNYAQEDYSLTTLRSITQKGGRYWFVEPADLSNRIVYAEITQRTRLVAKRDSFALFDLLPLLEDSSAVGK